MSISVMVLGKSDRLLVRKRSAPAPLAVALVMVGLLAVACGGSGDDDATRSSGATTTSATAAAGCEQGSEPVRDIAYERMSGVDDDLLSLDVYPAPHGCPAPVVVWVHGGAWQIGDKRNEIADKVSVWNDAGYAVVSVNYRLTDPKATPLVQYPDHDEDVAAAVVWVHDHIDEYGGDPRRIAVLGHSAGAQIVALVATNPSFLAARGLTLDALRCAGALDTEGYDVTAGASSGNTLYLDAFGTDPATSAEASAINHVKRGVGIPSFLVAERGTPRRRAEAEAFVARLRAAGVDVTVIDAGSLTHEEVNTQIGRPGDTVMTPPLSEFLAGCFR
jgi:arylformamidase